MYAFTMEGEARKEGGSVDATNARAFLPSFESTEEKSFKFNIEVQAQHCSCTFSVFDLRFEIFDFPIVQSSILMFVFSIFQFPIFQSELTNFQFSIRFHNCKYYNNFKHVFINQTIARSILNCEFEKL